MFEVNPDYFNPVKFKHVDIKKELEIIEKQAIENNVKANKAPNKLE